MPMAEGWLLIGDSRTVAMWSPFDGMLAQTAEIQADNDVFIMPHAVIGGMLSEVNPDFDFLLGGPYPPHKVVFLIGENDRLTGLTPADIAPQLLKLYDTIPNDLPVYFVDCPVLVKRDNAESWSMSMEYGCGILGWQYKHLVLAPSSFDPGGIHCTNEGYASLLKLMILLVKD